VKLAIIGAAGFIGRHLSRHAAAAGWQVTRIVRRPETSVDPRLAGIRTVIVADDAAHAARIEALRDHEVAICLAARNHRMRDRAPDPLQACLAGNRDAPLDWARCSLRAGLRRFVFVSSVKAAAERSTAPLRETDPPAPEDAYGISKLAAEQGLMLPGPLDTIERVVVRPPLVYGPQVGANFGLLLRLAASGLPLPLGGALAPRSLLSATNLCDALLACAGSPAAAGRCFYAADGQDLSVAELLARLRAAAVLPPRLFAVPPALLRAGAALAGRGEYLRRLVEPLQVDTSAIRTALRWSPPQAVDDALRETMAWHLASRRGKAAAA